MTIGAHAISIGRDPIILPRNADLSLALTDIGTLAVPLAPTLGILLLALLIGRYAKALSRLLGNDRSLQMLAILVVIFPSSSHAEDLLDPSRACSLLANYGLPARGDYGPVPGGPYECRSQEKKLVLGGAVRHTLRFQVRGTPETAEILALELSINSREDVQLAHAKLARYAEILIREALATEMPEEMRAAILSAVSGRWVVASAEVVVEKAQIHAVTYELWFRIRLPAGSRTSTPP